LTSLGIARSASCGKRSSSSYPLNEGAEWCSDAPRSFHSAQPRAIKGGDRMKNATRFCINSARSTGQKKNLSLLLAYGGG
jgi:hypothetical protein